MSGLWPAMEINSWLRQWHRLAYSCTSGATYLWAFNLERSWYHSGWKLYYQQYPWRVEQFFYKVCWSCPFQYMEYYWQSAQRSRPSRNCLDRRADPPAKRRRTYKMAHSHPLGKLHNLRSDRNQDIKTIPGVLRVLVPLFDEITFDVFLTDV